MKLQVTIDGRATELELRQDAEGWVANGRRVSVVEVERGIYSVLVDGRSLEARMEPAGDGVAVNIGPRRYAVEVADPRRAKRRSAWREGRQQVTSPMPGKVVRVLVAAGDAVAAGQGIAVVEAMKMQNELKSPKAGRVASLGAIEGAAVAAGEVLAVIE